MVSFCSDKSSRDVVVTGLGMVTPLGLSTDETWRRLIAGETACRSLLTTDIDHFDQLSRIPGLQLHGASVDAVAAASQLQHGPALDGIPADVRLSWLAEPLISFSLLSLQEAMLQAQLSHNEMANRRTAVVFGSSKGGLRTAEALINPRSSLPATDWTSRFAHSFASDCATRAVAAVTGAKAGALCPVAACATGLVSLIQGAAMIASGHCDVCIVGSADAGLRASVVSSFHRLRVTSRLPNAPTACRPFDVDRDGFVIGEGAATIILESRAHVEARGALPLAQVVSGGWLSDPTGMTQIDASGQIVEELLRRTVPLELVPDMISLHGTGTETNDLAESRGVHAMFGLAPMSFGVKGAIGHLLGAAGSVETALTIHALTQQTIPGTTNLTSLDPECCLNMNSSAQHAPAMKSALKLSLGFGGHVACGVFQVTKP